MVPVRDHAKTELITWGRQGPWIIVPDAGGTMNLATFRVSCAPSDTPRSGDRLFLFV